MLINGREVRPIWQMPLMALYHLATMYVDWIDMRGW